MPLIAHLVILDVDPGYVYVFVEWTMSFAGLFFINDRLKAVLKRTALKFGLEIKRTSLGQGEMVSLQSLNPSIGDVLLSHSLRPFLLKKGEPLPHNHSGHWRGLEIARAFLDLNYSVDVIDYHNKSFIPKKDYSIFVDFYVNLERIAPLMKSDCLKIMHIETAHWMFQNSAEYNRYLALQQRRGICLQLRRQLIPHWAIEHADCGIIQGNDFTCSTYGYANKPLYRVPTPTLFEYPWPEEKDWEACRKHFLWFGSGGAVHKGLDLVLEVFAQMPTYHLTVCGPVEREEDFVQAYHKELYQTPNIKTFGWVDTASSQFIEISNKCMGLIHPSCSEGQSGAVVTCLHAALIPILSYESGVDVDGFGFTLKDCSIEEIKESVQRVANLPIQELKERGRQAWEFARANHTKERFAEDYRKALTQIIAGHGIPHAMS